MQSMGIIRENKFFIIFSNNFFKKFINFFIFVISAEDLAAVFFKNIN